MRWDIFCKVIDNHGDAGVCWRLACGLARSGDAVRLWIDDPAALAWMAPAGCAGVSVVTWTDHLSAELIEAPAPDVLVEAFGCDPAPEIIAIFAQAAKAAGGHRPWINLEYLSAEPYVERLHGLPSPVFRGPGEGLTKHFFYPGFTEHTGGLLRENNLPQRLADFDRSAWLSARGIAWEGERIVSLFSYEPNALPELLAKLGKGMPTRLIVTPGRSAAAVRNWLARNAAGESLRISWLPHVPHDDFDNLLWASDLNFVRGEDSLVRAIWAGAPFIWQIYPQDDDAHHVKLESFLDWLQADASLREFHRVWNGNSLAPLAIPDSQSLAAWGEIAQKARAGLQAQDDLVTRLRRFVAQKS